MTTYVASAAGNATAHWCMSMSSHVMRSWTDNHGQTLCITAVQMRTHHVHVCKAGEDGQDFTSHNVSHIHKYMHAASRKPNVDATCAQVSEIGQGHSLTHTPTHLYTVTCFGQNI